VHNEAFNIGADSENYQVRELARIVQDTVPGCDVSMDANAGPDRRDYRVSFKRWAERFPGAVPAWNARSGAREIFDGFQRSAISLEEFEGPRVVRLKQLKQLIDAGHLDSSLRWRGEPPAEAPGTG
jgi:hypothetical protein